MNKLTNSTYTAQQLDEENENPEQQKIFMPKTLTLKVTTDSSNASTILHSASSRTFDESYFNSYNDLSFECLRLLLLSAISNLFLSSGINRKWKTLMIHTCNGTPMTEEEEDTSCSITNRTNLVPFTIGSPEAVEMLLTAAAHFDLDHYVDFLRQDWTAQLRHTLCLFPFPITVVSKDEKLGNPLLYGNHAWEKMSGECVIGSRGKSIWDLLHCEEHQEPEDEGESDNDVTIKLLKKAIRKGKEMIVGLSCHRKSGSEYFDLVGVAPVVHVDTGGQTTCSSIVMVHCEVKRDAKGSVVRVGQEQILLMKDLLSLLPLVVKV